MAEQTYDDLLKGLKAKTTTIGVIGLGYVGLPLAVTAAERGMPVVGFDIDPEKMTLLDAGQSYIDAVSDEDLDKVAKSGKLSWTTDFSQLSSCGAIIICVPTPLTTSRDPDLRYVEATSDDIAGNMSSGTLVVLESTTFPGTTEEVLAPRLAAGGKVMDQDFWLAFSPEREDPGNERYRTATIPKIVGADSDQGRNLASALYEAIVDHVVPVSSAKAAEAVKITENIFRAVNIALVNELKLIYDAMDIDIWEVVDGASTKPFGYMPFYPGPGLGGHCIPIDPFYLTWRARQFDLPTRFIELAGEINVNMPRHVVGRLREVLDNATGRGLKGSRVLIVGMSYKKNVPDMRESPSVKLMDLLLEQGAEVEFIDPHVGEVPKMRDYPHLQGRKALPPSDLGRAGIDIVLISTDHDAIDYDTLNSLGVPIVDTRNAMERRGLALTHVTKA